MIYKANFDYEYKLFDIPISSKKENLINHSLEYLFLITEDSSHSLYSTQNFSKEYLDLLSKHIGRKLPSIVKESCEKNWWGRLENLEFEKKVNSKIFCLNTLKELGYLSDKSKVIESHEEFIEHTNNFSCSSWLIRSPFLLQAKSALLLNEKSDKFKQNIINLLNKSKMILTPKYDRVLDFSIRVKFENNSFATPSYSVLLNDLQGHYRGSFLVSSLEVLSYFIEDESLINEFECFLDKLLKKLTPNFQDDYILQIDSFIYIEDGQKKLYPACEFNMRKSMSWVLENTSYLKTKSDELWANLNFDSKFLNNSVKIPTNHKSQFKLNLGSISMKESLLLQRDFINRSLHPL